MGDKDSSPNESSVEVAWEGVVPEGGGTGGLGPLDPTGVDPGSGPSGSIGQGESAWPPDR